MTQCNYKYKGQQFPSLAAVKAFMETENQIRSDIDYLFEQTPQLAEIGTKDQYKKFLATIFPDSTVKDIV